MFQNLDDKRKYTTIAISDENGDVYCANEKDYFDLVPYKNKDMSSNYYKIIKVYGKPERKGVFSFTASNRELIYDAEPKQMTKAEIEKILGYSIDIIG